MWRVSVLIGSLFVMLSPTRSPAAFHAAVIDEIMSGAAGNPDIQYVEIRMIVAGQVFTNGSKLVTFSCDGSTVTTVLTLPSGSPGNVPNGGTIRWLMGSPDVATFMAASGTDPDFTWNAGVTGSIPTTCGQVCWGKPINVNNVDSGYVDCVAYGPYTGPLRTGAGPPTSNLPGGGTFSLRRAGASAFDNFFVNDCPSPTDNDLPQTPGSFGPCVPPTTTTTTTSTTTTSTIAPGLPQLITGKRFKLGDDPVDFSKRRAKALSKDPAISLGAGNLSGDDPVVTGGSSLRVVSPFGDVFDDTYPLPSTQWTYIGDPGENRGYKYKDRAQLNGPIKVVIVKNGKLVKATGKGAGLGHSLGANPNPVDVVLQMGSKKFCMSFDGEVTFTAGKRYSAKDAPPPATCP